MTTCPTPEQRQAADPATHAWVSACAGAGKTSILIDRVVRLLLTGVKPQSIICLTYTKAAANEIAERLFDRLGTWCIQDDADLTSALAALGAAPEQDIALARGLFADALETPGGLRIQTIHSFCASLLRHFPLEAGVPCGFVEIDETKQNRLRQIALNAVIGKASTDPVLDEALRTVITTARGGGLFDVITEVCTRRASFAQRLSQPEELHEVLIELRAFLRPPDASITDLYTRAMETDLPRRALESLIDPLRCTGDSPNGSNCKLADIIEAALDRDADTSRRYQAYRGIVFTSNGEERKSNPYTQKAKELDTLNRLFSTKHPQGSEILRILEADKAIGSRICHQRSEALITVCAKVLQHYRREMKRRGWLDYDDLIRHALALLGTSHAAEWVAWKLDGGITHILIDEAQDTSPEQWTLLEALSAEFFAGISRSLGTPRTLFAVGDQRQSIYSFHGAVPADFPRQRQNFLMRCENAQARPHIVTLNTSFRSAPEILTFVDAVSKKMPDRATHQPESIQPPPETEPPHLHHAHRSAARGRVELWLPKRVDPPSTTPVKTVFAQSIARHVKEALERGEPVGDDLHALAPEDIMVLVRGRTDGLFEALHRAFRSEGLPVVGADRIRLTDSPAVQDCLNLIRFALCPQDDLVLAELLTSPFCGLNENDHLFALAYDRGRQSVWHRLRNAADLTSTQSFLTSVLALAHLPPFEFLSSILDHPVLPGNRTGREALFARFGAPEQHPVDALIDTALAAEASPGASLQRFVSDLENHSADITADMTGSGQIRIMTVHAAKGAEAPMVILADCSAEPRKSKTGVLYTDKNLPVWPENLDCVCPPARILRLSDKNDRLEDSHRLLYVAMTRARDLLLVAGPWHGSGKTGYASESWLAPCLDAMETLSQKGLARKENDHRIVIGRDWQKSDTVRFSESTRKQTPPDWLTTPVRPETGQQKPLSATDGASQFDTHAQRRGRLIHDLLNRLHTLDPDARAAAAWRYLQHQIMPDSDKAEAIQTALQVLSDPTCSGVYSDSGRSEVPIAGNLHSGSGQTIPVNGRIDRLIVTDEFVSIVEVKTDRPAPPDPTRISTRYLTQLATYALTIGQAFPAHAVRAAFLWTDGPRLMPVDADVIEAHRPS